MGSWPWTVVYWGFVSVSTLTLFPIALLIFVITLPFDRRRVVLHRFTCFWASLYTWFNPLWPVTVVGREKIDPRRTYYYYVESISMDGVRERFTPVGKAGPKIEPEGKDGEAPEDGEAGS